MLTKGNELVSSVIYHINDLSMHDSTALSELISDKRVLIFMGPAPFSRLDTEQASEYETLSSDILSQGIDQIMGIYVQDAFVMKKFQEQVQSSVNSKNIKFYGDGDAFLVKANNIMEDFTFQGLSVRVGRWAVIVKNSIIEAVFTDDHSVIENTRASNILKYLKNEA
jgi:peroxiredoxin